jgi:hypothetical protein
MRKPHRSVAALSAICLLGTSLPPAAFAAPAPTLISTTEALSGGDVQQRIFDLLSRDEVREGLIARGVDPAQVRARVAALTDEEARQLARQIDELPAGGDVLGVLFTVFIVLLITDILGLTKVFPFTRPIR